MGDVHVEAGRLGLGTVTGVSSLIGVGLLLTGGIGYLSFAHGWGCEQITWAEMVTADGDVIEVSAEVNPELLWAVRGAAPNFGIVTSLEIKLHRVPQPILAGGMMWAGEEKVREVLRWLGEFQAQSSDELAMYGAVDVVSSTDGRPAELRGQRVVDFIVCHVGETAAPQRELDEIPAAFPPLSSTAARRGERSRAS